MVAFMGMRGSGDWGADERPLNWRQGILYLYPNGMAPLTAIMSMLKERRVDDAQYHWWTKTLATQGGAIAGVFTDSILSSAYTSGGVDGDTLYVQIAEAVAEELRAGHQVLLRDASHLDVDVNAKVTQVVKSGAASFAAVRLIEDDDNGASTDLSDADTILVNGNINPEGGPMPEAVGYNPVKYFNYTQILRTALSITRTAKLTNLRTEDAYKEAKRESLELHSIEMEKALLFGIKTENIGANGKPERTTQGLISFIREFVSTNVSDFSIDPDFSTQSWLAGGEEWLDTRLEQIFRYGAGRKFALVGSGTLLGINRLAKTGGQIQLNPQTTSYGLEVREWITPFGTIYMKTHPLFSFDATTRNAMVILEPEMLAYRYLTDTTFYPDKSSGINRVDGINEEWLTEMGLELHHPEKFGFLSGFNTDNVLS